jgi:Fe2+ transport system protein FeoA
MVRTLDNLTRGIRGQVLGIEDEPDCANCLRRMGLREGVEVEVLAGHDPVMLRVDGCCMAFRRGMLRGVTVCRIDAA